MNNFQNDKFRKKRHNSTYDVIFKLTAILKSEVISSSVYVFENSELDDIAQVETCRAFRHMNSVF